MDRPTFRQAIESRGEHRAEYWDSMLERRIVKYTIDTLAKGIDPSELREFYRKGSEYTWDNFYELLPEFSVGLACGTREFAACLDIDPAMVLSLVLRQFEKTTIYVWYERLKDDVIAVRGNKPVGIIVPFKGVPKGLIIHNHPDVQPRPTAVVYKNPKNDTALCVQTYASFLSQM